MKSIIERLYSGEIYPAEQIIPSDPDYRPLTLKTGEERKYLIKKLGEEDSVRLESLHDMYMKQCSMDSYASFSYGLKLGALLIGDIMWDNKLLDNSD